MALKTVKTKASVAKHLAAVEDPQRRADCKAVAKMMEEVTGSKPAMWGETIVGFGSYRYPCGRDFNDWPLLGMAPRKDKLTVYIMPGYPGADALVAKLGKVAHGQSCFHLKKLADVDTAVLEKMMRASVAFLREKYPA